MKQVLFSLLAFLVLLLACTQNNNDSLRQYIPGIYLKQIRQEFSMGIDSLVIQEIDPEANLFSVCRNTSYQQKINGQLLSPKRDRYMWKAVYDNNTQQLIISGKERTITFLPAHNKLMLGNTEYNKIK